MTSDARPPKKRGCLFYGCVASVSVAIVGTILAVIIYQLVARKLNRMVADYTDTSPKVMETVTYSPAEKAALEARVTSFKESLDNSVPDQELILTASDLNALIAATPDLKGRLFLKIENNAITGSFTLPLRDLNIEKLRDRHLNGEGTFSVSLTGGLLDVRLQRVVVNSRPLPSLFMNQIKKKNLAEEALRDPGNAAEVRKFGSIEVKDDTIILRSKKPE